MQSKRKKNYTITSLEFLKFISEELKFGAGPLLKNVSTRLLCIQGRGPGVITASSKQAKITVERKIKRNKERKDTQDRLSVVGLNAARRLS